MQTPPSPPLRQKARLRPKKQRHHHIQTPEAWAAQQKEYAQYDAQLSPDQQFAALQREFPDADPRALGRIVAEFDPRKGLSLSTLVREKLGLPDPNSPAGTIPAAPPQPASPAPGAATPPTTVNNKPLIKGSAAERWADRIIKNARGNMNMGIDPVVQTAYTIKGAALIESGLRTFAEWSQHMVKEFGETIRPHLEGLWQRSGEHVSKLSTEKAPSSLNSENSRSGPSSRGPNNPDAPVNSAPLQHRTEVLGPKLDFEPSPNLEWHVNFEEGRHLRPTAPFDISRKPSGPLKVLPKNDVDPGNRRGCDGENEAAVVLPQNGYDYQQVTQTKRKKGGGTFDGAEDGTFAAAPHSKSDVYSPAATKKIKGIHDEVFYKVNVQNAPYVIVRLEKGGQDVYDLRNYFKQNKIEGLNQLFVVKEGKLYIVY